MDKTLYDILGVKKTATQDEIKKAYKKRAKETHPDKNEGKEDEFRKVKAAYETLSNEHKRKIYDKTGLFIENETNQNFFNDIHDHFFKGINNNPNALSSDIVGIILSDIDEAIKASKDRCEQILNDITKISRFKGKIKLKEGMGDKENIFEKIITGQINSLNYELEHFRNLPPKLEQLKLVVSQYECDNTSSIPSQT